jgi:hypothetical protein
MYSLSTIEKIGDQLFLCVKYNGLYRYYGIVYTVPAGHLISLIDKYENILDHFTAPSSKTPQEALLDICREYDMFWYPELFENNSQSVDN